MNNDGNKKKGMTLGDLYEVIPEGQEMIICEVAKKHSFGDDYRILHNGTAWRTDKSLLTRDVMRLIPYYNCELVLKVILGEQKKDEETD